LFHLEPLQFLPLTAIGFLLAVVYQYTGSIWPPILLHASINLIGVSAAYFIANSGWV
jgi:membrane protease YdiL (CAAX protease family)